MTHEIKDHECFTKLINETGSDATFVFDRKFDFGKPGAYSSWRIVLYRYTPSLNISKKRGYFIPNFCPMCGEDFRENSEMIFYVDGKEVFRKGE